MGRTSGQRSAVSRPLIIGMIVALAAVAVGVLSAAAPARGATGDSVPLPSADPFYAWSGSLAGVAPGTVLRSRQVTLVDGMTGDALPYPTYQLLYRTTNQLGQPSVTVTTVIRPLVSAGTPKIVSYQDFYDALGPVCDPSYTFQGPNGSYSADDQQFALDYVAAGDTVVDSDYEGERLDWVAGRESGYNTLDGVRAAESFLKTPAASTPVAMVGYSGGAIATVFAADLAPSYSPSLDIVGDAAGGVLADVAHNTPYVNGSQDWSGVMPAVLVALGRAFGIDIGQYESAYGAKVSAAVGDQCINSFLGNYPGLTLAKLLKPQYANMFGTIPAVAKIANQLIMSDAGTPKGPIYLENGNADGTGDGVMIAGDVEGLAHAYCQKGVPVEFDEYKGLDHTEAAVPFEANALKFVTSVLNGLPVQNGCSQIGAGNALTPLPVPVLHVTLGKPSVNSRRHALLVPATPSLPEPQLTFTLRRGKRLVVRKTLSQVLAAKRDVVLRVRNRAPKAGRYTLSVTAAGVTAGRRSFRISR